MLLLGGSSAWGQGTIAYVRLSTPNPDPNFPWDFEGMRLSGGKSYNLDLNNDGVPDYVIDASGPNSTRGFGIYAQGPNGVWATRPFDSSLAAALPAGVEIGQGLASSTYTWTQNDGRGSKFSVCVDIGCLGFYTALDSAYTALRFDLNGETHYGWVRVGSPLGGNFGWIYDYAYDTRPGAAILTGAIPEPSTLALVTVGVAALFARRRAMSQKSPRHKEKP